ncbi:MAG: hypothetical protein LC777_16670 [Actinobacteria bacterium]|nr:hypothetical protein [Actinomycetota bacterium]
MADDWRKIDRGLFESPDGQWRISNPWKLRTELRHRWFVAQRRSDRNGWRMHDGHHATLHDARAYIATLNDGISAVSIPTHERERRSGRGVPGG